MVADGVPVRTTSIERDGERKQIIERRGVAPHGNVVFY